MIALEDIPDDDYGDVLRQMRTNGDSLTQPRQIDFSVVFPTEQAALAFCDAIAKHDVEVSYEEGSGLGESPWDVTVTREMVPDHAAIIAMEEWLASHFGPFGGVNDGWGCFNMEDLELGEMHPMSRLTFCKLRLANPSNTSYL